MLKSEMMVSVFDTLVRCLSDLPLLSEAIQPGGQGVVLYG